VRKEGSAFDLPIALSILAAHGLIPEDRLTGLMVAGELTLAAEVRPVRGALAMALTAARVGARTLLIPERNRAEVGHVAGIEVVGCDSLVEACSILMGEETPEDRGRRGRVSRPGEGTGGTGGTASAHESPPVPGPLSPPEVDLAQIAGQPAARRALEVAAAGGHNLLLIGPPGTGKTLLARALPAILPEMDEEEALEATLVHSVAGQLREGVHRLRQRPFRAPHHTVSAAGLVGGGAIPRPGEVSLAHCGVLFLDELPEFRTPILNLLRQPLEEGSVRLVRAGRTVRFPCRFALAAAMNPCPCGFLGHPVKPCRCTPHQVRAYQGRISGPLLDRMDLHVEVPALSAREVAASTSVVAEGSLAVRARVDAARIIQRERYADRAGIYCNSQMALEQIEELCGLTAGVRAFLERAVESLSLSARAVHRSLRVARTVADLDGDGPVLREHVAEAIQYRWLDRRHDVA
ncbi:MAG: YifB family Mg chelatase-like AAA ATPase, partial [Candidatus Eisenbacteria bacterium]|nr:YifB family Mg chelatase-like AAA ATPase [Candidatus Eisenbacteria bacterium]